MAREAGVLTGYRKIVDFPTLPRAGESVLVAGLDQDVSWVRFREDGRPEVHFASGRMFGDDSGTPMVEDARHYAARLLTAGYSGVTEWDEID